VEYDGCHRRQDNVTALSRYALAGLLITATALAAAPAFAEDNGVVLYGAGSLREAMTEIAAGFTYERGTPVRAEFGASGRMRERIEAGDKVDLFTSADIGHAAKLVADGRASVMAMFSRNELCLLSPSARSPASPAGVLDTLLAERGKIGVSPARIDPLGDYTEVFFDLADKAKPDSGKTLRSRTVVLDNPTGSPPSPSGDYTLDALRENRIGLAIVYCSGKERYARLDPGVVVTQFPPDLATGPQYGLAVLKDAKPEGVLLALTILSPAGQKILAKHGFKPVTEPDSR
jgi:ABC-type molybdate transport system substrate-binding protein